MLFWQCATIVLQDSDEVDRVGTHKASTVGRGIGPSNYRIQWPCAVDDRYPMTFSSATPGRLPSGQVVTEGEIFQTRDEIVIKMNVCCVGSQQLIVCVATRPFGRPTQTHSVNS